MKQNVLAFGWPYGDSSISAKARQRQALLVMAVSILLGTIQAHIILTQALADFEQQTRSYSIAQTEIWSTLLQSTKFHSLIFLYIGSPIGTLSLWMVKVVVLWCFTILFGRIVEFKQIARLVSYSYIPYIILSIIGLAILLTVTLKGNVGSVSHVDAAAAFSSAITSQFSSLKDTLAFRLVDGLRLSSEICGSGFILYRLDTSGLLNWRRGLVAVLVMTAILHFPTILTTLEEALR